jgi:hypothetical protein
MAMGKVLKKGNLGTNFSVITNYGLSLPAKKKPKAVELNPAQFQYKLELAKKYFIYGFRSFKSSDLKTKYKLTLKQSKEMYSILLSFLEEFKNNHYTNSAKPVAVEVRRVIPTLQDRLNAIRSKHATLISKHGEHAKFDEGFVYLLDNPAFPGWVKVGMTIDYESRLKVYNITNDPHQLFKFIKIRWVENRRNCESETLKLFEENADSFRGEWFKIDANRAIELFN